MGAGRKTETVVLQKRPPPQWNSNTNPYSSRNLVKKDLGGVIFGCKHSTYKECMSKLLFGLPAAHFQYVKNVTQGMTLFLFNYSDRKLHGIFEAVSAGQMKIDPHAWTSDGQEETQFPAQVRVKVRNLCVPLNEDQFKPILAKNYRPHDPNCFWFELDTCQNEKLVLLLSAFPVRQRVSTFHPAAKQGAPLRLSSAQVNNQKTIRNDKGKHKREAYLDQFAPEKHGNVISCPQGKTWTSLFNANPDSISKEEHRDSKRPALEGHIPCQNHFSMLYDPSEEEENEVFEIPSPRGITNEVDKQVVSSVPNSEFFELSDTEDGMPSLTEIFDQIALAADMLDDREDTEKAVTNEDLSFESNNEWTSSLPVLHLGSQFEMAQAPLNTGIYEQSCMGPVIYEQSCMRPEPCSEGSNNSVTSGIVDPEENASQNVLIDANEGGTCFSEGIVSETEPLDLQTLVTKLFHEVVDMKRLLLNQNQKIERLEHELVESNKTIEELRYHTRDSVRSSSSLPPGQGNEIQFQKRFEDSNQSVLLVGGFNGVSWLPDLDLFSPSKGVMQSLEPMSSVRTCISSVMLNNAVYILGGGSEPSCYYTVELYNLESNRWVSCPSLNTRKGSLAGACLSDKIFAIGGGNDTGCLSEVEVLDPNIGKWVFTCSMMQKRFAPAAAQLNGALYVAGGYDEQDYLKSMERLDPRESSWTRLQSMTTRRGCLSLAVLNEKLYAIGGFDGHQMIPTVEVFEPRVGSWMISEPLKCARGYMGAVTIGNNILAICGTRDDVCLDTVECYSECEGWQMTDLKSVGKRCFFSAVVV